MTFRPGRPAAFQEKQMEENELNAQTLSRKTISGIFWKFAERFTAQVVSTIVGILLARILVPEDYAVVSVVTIYFTFCNLFISSGLNAALIQKKNADILDYSTILYTNLLIAVILYVAMFLLAPLIARIYEQPLLTPVIRVMGISLFVNGIKAVICAKVSNDLRFRMFFWATLIGTVISAVLGITMALNGFGAWALVVQQLSNSLIDTVVLTMVSRIRFVLRFSTERFKALFRYGFYLFLAGFINTTYEEIRPLFVGIRFSTTDLAFYNKGMQYPRLIHLSLNDTLASVLFPVMSKAQEDLGIIRAMTRRFICVCSYIVFPVMLGLFAVADNLIVLLLKEKWAPIIIYVKIFSVTGLLGIIQNGNLLPIRAIGRSDVILKLDIIKKTLFFLILVVFLIFAKNPQMLAAMGVFTTLIAFAVNSYATQKLIDYKIKTQVLDIITNLIPAAIMCAVVSLMNRIPINPYVLLSAQILSGALLYCALSILFRNSNFRYLWGYTAQIRNALSAKHSDAGR